MNYASNTFLTLVKWQHCEKTDCVAFTFRPSSHADAKGRMTGQFTVQSDNQEAAGFVERQNKWVWPTWQAFKEIIALTWTQQTWVKRHGEGVEGGVKISCSKVSPKTFSHQTRITLKLDWEDHSDISCSGPGSWILARSTKITDSEILPKNIFF